MRYFGWMNYYRSINQDKLTNEETIPTGDFYPV